MRKRLTPVALAAALAVCVVPVHAAEMARTDRQAVERILAFDEIGTPNWFEGAYYSGRYEDLKRAFGDDEALLYQHGMSFGFREGRIVLPVLDVVKYRAYYPDLEQAFGDDWSLYIRHYFEFGIREGRKNFTDFDAETYLELNPDLKDICGTSLTAATVHYLEYGFAEGRNYIRTEKSETEEKKIRATNQYYESDDSDDRDDSVSGLFSGEQKFYLEDGTYLIRIFVNGVKKYNKYYNQDHDLFLQYEYDDNGDKLLKAIQYPEDGGKYESVYEYDANGEWAKVLSKKYDQNGEVRMEVESEYVEGRRTRMFSVSYTDSTSRIESVLDYNEAEKCIKHIQYTYNGGKLQWKWERLYDSVLDENGDLALKKDINYYYNERGELTEYKVVEYENGKRKKETKTIYEDKKVIRIEETFFNENGDIIDQNEYDLTASPSNASKIGATSTASYHADVKTETASPSDAGRIAERSAVAG